MAYRHVFLSAGLVSIIAGLLSAQKFVSDFLRTHLLMGYEIDSGLVRLVPTFPALAITVGLILLLLSVLSFLTRRYRIPLANLVEEISERSSGPIDLIRRNSTRLSVIILAIVVFWVYFGSLSFNFLGDDFLYICSIYYGKVGSLLPWNSPPPPEGYPPAYHYKPIGILLVGFLYPLIGYKPHWFHFETLTFHMLNSVLIFILCRRFTKNTLVALLAGLLFVIYVSALEVVVWVSGTFYSAMTLFVLLGFLCFVMYFERGRKYYWAFVALYFVAQLTIEIAVLLIPLCLLYEVMFQRPWVKREGSNERLLRSYAGRLWKYIPPCVVLLCFIATKRYLGILQSNVFLSSLAFGPIFGKLVYGLVYMFMPGVNISAFLRADILVLAGLFAAFSFMVLAKGSRPMKFFYLWACLTMAAVLVLTAGFQQRYFYLPGVGASIFIAILLHDVCRWVSRAVGRDAFSEGDSLAERQREPVLKAVTLAIFLPLSLAIVLVGAGLAVEQQKGWRKASDTVTRVLEDIKQIFPQPPVDREVYFVDIPSQLISDEPPGIYRAFGVGFLPALALIYEQSFAADIHLRYTPYHPHLELPFSDPISYEELQELARDPEKVVVLYSEHIGSVQKLLPEPGSER